MKNISIFILLLSPFTLCGQWINYNTPSNELLTEISFINKDTGYCVGTNGLILQTINGANTWTQQQYQFGINNYLLAVEFSSPDTGYVGGGLGIFKTVDAGSNWSLILNSFSNYQIESIAFAPKNKNKITAVGGNGCIFTTIDAGQAWQKVPPILLFGDSLYDLKKVVYLDDSTLVAVGGVDYLQLGIVIKSFDNGYTWNKIFESDNFPQLTDMFFLNTNEAWATGTYFNNNPFYKRGRLLKTIDGGVSWHILDSIAGGGWSNYPLVMRSVVFTSFLRGYAVGYQNQTIFATVDGGLNWVNQNTSNMVFPFSIFFTDSLTGYIVGDSGKVLKTTNGGVGFFEQNVNTNSLSIYPSPCNGKFTLSVAEKPNKSKSIYVSTITGKLIYKKENVFDNVFQVDLTKEARGIYFVKVIQQNNVMVGKVILE